jgi:hypothetical protein
MANIVTVTKLLNTTKRDIIHVYVTGDGSGEETNTVLYDYSADAYQPTAKNNLWLEKVWASVDGAVSVDLNWDATTPVKVQCLPQYTPAREIDYSCFGGIKNFAGSGITGDLTFSTVGLGASEHASIVLDIRKA